MSSTIRTASELSTESMNMDALAAAGSVKDASSGSPVVRYSGTFLLPTPAPQLHTMMVTLEHALREVNGVQEMLKGPAGEEIFPLLLFPEKGSTATRAVFQTRQKPRIRLELSLRGQQVGVDLQVSHGKLLAPQQCTGTPSTTTLETSKIFIDDGVSSFGLIPFHVWECVKDRQGNLKELRLLQ